MVLIIVSLIILIILYIGYKKWDKYKNFFNLMGTLLFILVVLEFTLFNFRAYQSFFYKEINITDYTLGEGMIRNSDGSLSIEEDTEYNYIEIDNIYQHLNNFYIDLDLKSNSSNVMGYTLGFTDAANRRYLYTPDRRVMAREGEDGDIVHLQTSGKSRRIKIYFRCDKVSDSFFIKNISFNKKVPFNISLTRPFVILGFGALFYLFRPKSSIYKLGLFDKKNRKYIGIAIVCQSLVMVGVAYFNYYFVKEDFNTKQRYQYQLLTEAFTKGQTYLDVEVDPLLLELKNPYDKKDRNRLFEEAYGEDFEEHYIWDAAFFKGKYYVYFGVAPVITYYLPYYMLTGTHIKTSTCIIITLILTVLGIFSLLYNICKKWFKKVNLGSFLIITLLFINASGLLAIAGRPDHYSLPILMGIMFSIFGLNCWMQAVQKNMSGKYLFLGSFCMAAVAACRPQLLLTSFFAIPIFSSKIFKERELFSKKKLKETILFVLPYIVIALLLMAYNYVRFGSVFDFGANYNLTTNDMTRRGFVLARIPIGIFYYLLAPVNIGLRFPFLMRSEVVTGYMGTTIYEPMGAGFIFANLLVLFGVFIYKFKDQFKDKLLYKLGSLSVIFAIIIIIADTQMAGILPRYICDFGFLLYFATALVLFLILDKGDKKDIMHKIIYIAFVVGIIYNVSLLFSDSALINSRFFFYIKHLFEFWM